MTGSPLFADDPGEPPADELSTSPPDADSAPPQPFDEDDESPPLATRAGDSVSPATNGNGTRRAPSALMAALSGGQQVASRQDAAVPARAPAEQRASAGRRDPLARLNASDAYRIRDGRYEPDTWWTRLRAQMATWSKSSRERELEAVDAALKRLRTRGVRTGQLIAVGSAKGGTGKDSIAITLGDVIASALRAPTLVLDADWDFGTLGERAPEEGRSPGTVLDVHAVRDQLVSPAQLGQFVARMPSGCQLLSAPRDPDEMERLEVKHYADVLETLRRFYSVIFVTMALACWRPCASGRSRPPTRSCSSPTPAA